MDAHNFKPGNGMSRNRRALVLGLAGAAVAGCGGGGGDSTSTSSTPATTPAAGAITVTTYPSSASGTAVAAISNASGDGVSIWTDPLTQQITQSLYKVGGTSAVRTYYDANMNITRIVNEKTGDFLVPSVVNNSRTDYNLYDAAGTWKAGFALLSDGTGKYSVAQILSSSGLQGKQITGDLSGPMVASYALLPSSNSGLGTVTPLSSKYTVAALTPASGVYRNPLHRLSDMLFPAAYAAPISTADFAKLASGTLLMMQGAAVVAGLGGSVPALAALVALNPAALAAGALLGAGAYLLHQGGKSALLGQMDGFQKSFGAALDDLGDLNDPASSSQSTMFNYDSVPAATLPDLSSLLSNAQTKVATAASNLQAAAQTAWQSIISAPPAGNTGLDGLMVDNQGVTYATTGTYNPSTNALTFQTGNVGGTSISGSANVATGNGTFTASRNGINSNGTVSTSKSDLGACQTQQSSGGQGAFVKSYDLGKDSGTFPLTYQMYSIPDALDVVGTGGTNFYSTGGLVSGGNTVQVTYSGGRIIFVKVNAPNSGTVWDYSIGCP